MVHGYTSQLNFACQSDSACENIFPMERLAATLCLTIAVLLGSAGCDEPPDFQKGFTAYKSGDYATALRNWAPLAEQGHATAQYNLGLMYRNGKGVPQNHKTAVKWYRLAAEQGDAGSRSVNFITT